MQYMRKVEFSISGGRERLTKEDEEKWPKFKN